MSSFLTPTLADICMNWLLYEVSSETILVPLKISW